MKLSVVIPMYNTSKWCEPLIKTLTTQQKSYKETEIILIDDGSTEDTSWINNYPTIVYRKKQNGGVSSARNLGLTLVTGDYVAFIDSDDMVSDDYLKVVYSETDGHDFLVYRHNIPERKMFHFPGLYPTYALWSYVIKMDRLRGITFNESKKFGEDIDVLRKIMKPNSDIKRIMKRIYTYNFRVNPDSINNRIITNRI